MSDRKQAVIQTSMGEITFELYYDEAPKTCKNFETLCQRVRPWLRQRTEW